MLVLGSLGGGLRYAFTNRRGGVSDAPYDTLNLSFDVGDDVAAVAENRRRVLQHLRAPDAVWLRAQHGSGVRLVDGMGGMGGGGGGGAVGGVGGRERRGESGIEPGVDGLVCAQPGVTLAALSADCALVVVGDPQVGVVGVVHCGRPGLIAGAVAATVGAARAQGATQLRVALGPAICGSCYEVPAEMAAVCDVVPAAKAHTPSGTPALDLAAGVMSQLRELDVSVVRRVGGCTREDPDAYSYRRDGRTGRMAALVWRE